MRLRLDLGYDGGDFHGWAAQPGLRTVQATFEEALARVLRVPRVSATCAGRTDTGVHARGQVVHLDLPGEALAAVAARGDHPPERALVRRVNGVLPPDVRVHRAVVVPETFDARFSALWRRYAYRIADGPELVDPLLRGSVVAWPRPLDLTAMNDAAERLLGEHDFASFCRRREGATTIRTLLDLHWQRDAAGLAVATVRADAFCHSMVRALVGCLVAVGESRREPGWAGEVMLARRRDPGVTVMRALGLTLEEVAYPVEADFGSQATAARVLRTLSDPDRHPVAAGAEPARG